MSIRWRKTGELLCGAKHPPMEGDVYIDDQLHYDLVTAKVLKPTREEKENGLWYLAFSYRHNVKGRRAVKKLLRLKQDGLCGICKKKLQKGQFYNIDHIQPISMNGYHTLENLQATHAGCNRAKGSNQSFVI